MLCTLQVPKGVDWASVVKNAMEKYNVEIAGGLGPTAGKVWRVGIMVCTPHSSLVQIILWRFQNSARLLFIIVHEALLGRCLQGYNAKLENVELVIAAFRDGLQQQGYLK